MSPKGLGWNEGTVFAAGRGTHDELFAQKEELAQLRALEPLEAAVGPLEAPIAVWHLYNKYNNVNDCCGVFYFFTCFFTFYLYFLSIINRKHLIQGDLGAQVPTALWRDVKGRLSEKPYIERIRRTFTLDAPQTHKSREIHRMLSE